jgi:hypothetical protein
MRKREEDAYASSSAFEKPVNFLPATRGLPEMVVFLKTAGAWQTAAVIFPDP